jgi:hypothetical protein
MDFLFGLFFWAILSILVGVFAQRRGRMGFGYFMLSLMFSPLLIWLVVLAIGPAPAAAALVAEAPSPKTHIRCPDCREFVLKDARKCKHCGAALVPQ